MAAKLLVRSLVIHDPGMTVATSYRIIVAVSVVGEVVVVVAERVRVKRR